jgi:two-component system sensor histidine kinase/response regulator
MLDNFSFVVDEAPSGEDAIEMVRKVASSGKSYDIIFVDWQMPGLDGIETGKQILTSCNFDTPPHLVMVTAYGREDVLKQAERSGFENVLIKPVTSSILFDIVVGALGTDVEAAETAPAVSSFDVSSIRGSRVLLVEDNEINQEVAIGLLEDAELFVDLAENGADAVRMVRENDYDIVLMDMQMPVMDGIEATQVIRSDAGFQDLPIVAMTANAMAADREKCLKAGMNDHLGKPIDPEQLFGALLHWIKRPDGEKVSTEDQTLTKTPTATHEAVVDDAPLEIVGVDTKSALKRIGGNRKRYETLLRQFAQQQANVVEAIRDALSSGDRATAERTAHSLKGAAGTLGAMAVSEAAAKVEAAIRTGQSFDLALTSLSGDLARAVEAIQAALPEERSANADGAASTDTTAAVELMRQLKGLLESDDGEAADLIIDARPNLAGVLTDIEIENLSERIGNFEFEAALKCLSGVASRLSLDIEGK